MLLVIGFLIPPACYQAFVVRGSELGIFPTRAGWHAFLGSGATGGIAREHFREITLQEAGGTRKALAITGRIDGMRDALRFARIETGDEISNADAGRHWWRRASDDFFSQPRRFLKTYFTKLGLFAGPSEPPANLDQRFISRYSGLLRSHIFVFAIIAPLGLVGLVTAARRKSAYAAIFIPLYAVVASAYLISDSEKLVVIPFLALFAGAMVDSVITSTRNLMPVRRIIYVVAAVIVGVLLYLGPKHPMEEARQLVYLGDVYSEEALFEKAQDSYRQAMDISPRLPDTYIAMAKMYGGAGKTDDGLALLDQALGLGIDDPRLRIEKASLLIKADRPQEALQELKGLEVSHPYEPGLHQLRGLSLLATGRVAESVVELDREIAYVGGGFITFSALGRAKLALGEYEDAAEYLESALSLNPYHTPAAMQLADAYTRLEYHLKACDILSRGLTIDPGNMPLRFKLANCLYRAGRLQEALTHFGELHKFDPGNADIALNMGTVYAAMDSLDRAVEMWEKALVLDPGNEMARENLRTARE